MIDALTKQTHFVFDARTATPHFPGIGRYVTNLARALLPGLSVDECLTVLYDADHPQTWPDAARFRAVPLRASPFGLAQQWAIPRLLKELGADLYHSAYYLMPYRPGVPAVLTVYDLIPLLFPRQSSRRARLLFRWATHLALRAVHCCVAISEATRQDLIQHFRIAPDRVVYVPLAADPTFAPQPASSINRVRQAYGLPDRYVLYLGSNKPHKNLVRLVEAWARLQPSPAVLVIAGAWDQRYPEARQRATALGLEHSVRFLGPVPEGDLPALYAAAIVFAFPSLYEGFGLPVLEAMACGTPVVCSNTSSLPEVAGNAALYFDPCNVEMIAGSLDRVLADPELCSHLCELGFIRASQFLWERTAQQALELYRKLISDLAQERHGH